MIRLFFLFIISLNFFVFSDEFVEFIEEEEGLWVQNIQLRGTNPKPSKTIWKYGLHQKLETLIEEAETENERLTSYSYDQKGNLCSITKPDGTVLFYRYDSLNRLTELFSSDHTIHYVYTFNEEGKIICIDDLIHQNSTLRQFDDQGRLVQEHFANSLKIAYTFSKTSHSLILPDDSKVTYEKMDDGHIRVFRSSSQNTLSYEFVYQINQKGQIQSLRQGENTLFSYCYDENGALASQSSPYYSENILRQEDKVISRKRSFEGALQTDHFTYTEKGQLSQASTLNQTENFFYDSCNNLQKEDEEHFSYDSFNQILSSPYGTYIHDKNGNLIELLEHQAHFLCSYDPLDRLIEVEKIGEKKLQFTYDAFDRRLSKTVYLWDASKEEWIFSYHLNFIYDGQKEIGAVNEKGQIQDLRFLSKGIGGELLGTLCLEVKGTPFYCLHDFRGSIIALVDLKKAKLISFYDYSAFGERKTEQEAIFCPFGFSGKRIDPETGWLYFGKRYYLPHLGRWMTQDPLGFFDGFNRYVFSCNDPIGKVDLFGLFSLSSLWQGIAHFLNQAVENLATTLHSPQQLLPFPIQDYAFLENMLLSTFDTAFLTASGFYQPEVEVGIFGNHEIHPKVRLSMINGILSLKEDLMETLNWACQHHGMNRIHYVYRPTGGWSKDVLNGILAKSGYLSNSAAELAKLWKSLIQEMGGVHGGGLIIHYAHSLGTIESWNAHKLLDPEEKKMIRLVSFGSPLILHNEEFESVLHYVSKRDGVSLLDPFNYFFALISDVAHIEFIGAPHGFPLIDHFMASPTYQEVMKILGKKFLETYQTSPL